MIDSIEQEIRTLRSLFWSGRDPEGRAFVPLADAYRRAGDFRQAVELLTEGLNRHPTFTSAHVVAAQLYHEKGLAEEAELAFRRVLELDPENIVALELLADSLHGRGEADAASELRGRYRELEGVGQAAPAEEAVGALSAWAPEVEAEPEPIMDLAELAPDEPEPVPEPVMEPVMDLAELAPDEPEPVPEPVMEPVMDLAEFAPDEPEPVPEPVMEPVMDLAEFAPDEPEPVPEPVMEPVMDLAELAPDEPEPVPEPVMDLAELAPDEPEPVMEPVMDLAELAPDEPEPVLDLADLAPDDSDLLVGEIDAASMVTRTMAELFASQGLVDRALEVFRQLLDTTPDDEGLRRRVAELSARLGGDEAVAVQAETEVVPFEEWAPAELTQDDDDLSGHAWDPGGQADHHEVDTPFAWTHQEPDEGSPPGPAISTYFSRMLGWEPGTPSAPDGSDTAPEPGGSPAPHDWLNREDT